MKYKGREIVAPEKFLPAMRGLLAYYSAFGKDVILEHCPLCDTAEYVDEIPDPIFFKEGERGCNCGACPWIVMANKRCTAAAEKKSETGDITELREERPVFWANYRIRQLRRWIAIYEKAAAEVPS